MHGSLQREDHLSRAVAWSLLQEPLQKLANMLVAAVKAIAELSDADMHAPQRALLHLPHRYGGFGIQRLEEEDVADAFFPAAAALADNAMARGPQRFRPLAIVGAATLRAKWERVRLRYPEVCPPDLPLDVFVQSFLPQAQRTITRAPAQHGVDQLLDAYVATGANMTPQQQALGVRDQARLRSCACTSALAWLATLPTAPSLGLQSEEYLISFRLRLGVSVLHQNTDYVQCFCHRIVNNVHSDHSLVCQSVKRTNTSRHNKLESS